MTWKDAEGALIRRYTKDLKDGNGIRIRNGIEVGHKQTRKEEEFE